MAFGGRCRRCCRFGHAHRISTSILADIIINGGKGVGRSGDARHEQMFGRIPAQQHLTRHGGIDQTEARHDADEARVVFYGFDYRVQGVVRVVALPWTL